MKKLIIAIILIAFVLLGAPYVTGKVAASQIDNIVAQLNQNPQQNGTTEILSYQRGFFSSKSSYRYQLPLQLRALLKNSDGIEVECDIDHGVISIDYQCNFADNPEYADFIAANFNGDDPISMFGKVTALGGFDSNITIAEINDFRIEEGASLDVSKTEFSVKTDKNLNHYDISGSTKNLSIKSGTESMIIGDLIIDGSLSPVEGDLVIGDFSFAVDKVDLINLESTVNIKGLKTNAIAELNGSNLDSKTEISIKAMTLANAPFETAENLDFLATVNGVNKEALIEYQAYTKRIQTQLLNQELTAAEVNPMEVIPILEKILSEGFNASIDLSGELDNKDNSFKLDLELLESVKMNDFMALVYAPQEMLNKLDVSIVSNFNKETVEADPKLAASVVGSPLFEESGDDYQMNIKLGSQVELNGQASSLDQLLTLMSATALQHQAQGLDEVEIEVEVEVEVE